MATQNQVTKSKQTERFEETIRQFLRAEGRKDETFRNRCNEAAEKFGKNTKDCCTYIISEVQKLGKCGFTDDEIYSLAKHYWDEDSITSVGECPNCQIVLNHEVELSPEEIEECKKEARERLIKQQMDSLRPKSKPTPAKKTDTPSLSLFDEQAEEPAPAESPTETIDEEEDIIEDYPREENYPDEYEDKKTEIEQAIEDEWNNHEELAF